jgi:hypothetical protein
MRKIPFLFSVKLTFLILVFVTIFNFSVMLNLVPYDIVWGGRLTSKEEMIRFELVSILLNIFSGLLVMIKAGYLMPRMRRRVNVIIWILPLLNFLGILGNAASKSDTERAMFLPVAIVMFLLTLRIALEKTDS